VTGDQYQYEVHKPASKTNADDLLAYLELDGGDVSPNTDSRAAILMAALGLTGEAGEVADAIKKGVFHKHGDYDKLRVKVKDELGDVLWYVARLATAFSLGLEYIMQGNIDKLNRRYEGGFSHEKSINRVS
jgi:NTP pyrophosphatase (non-canonical NTP hydrolase)